MDTRGLGNLLKIAGVIMAVLSVIGGFCLAIMFDSDLGIIFVILGVIDAVFMLLIAGFGLLMCEVADIKDNISKAVKKVDNDDFSLPQL